MTMTEIPRSRYKEFNRIYDAVNADEDQVASFELSKQFAASLPKTGTEKAGSKADESVDDLLADGNTALASGKFEDAERILQKVTTRDPSNADAWVLLGRVYSSTRLKDSHDEKAVDSFQHAVASNPRHRTAWALLGMNLEALGRYSEAAEAYQKQMQVTPENQGMNVALGNALLRAHRPAEAIPALEKSVTEGQNSAFARLQLARAYIQTGDQEKAMLSLEAAIKQRPGAMFRAAAAAVLADEGVDLDWAEQQIQQALASAYEVLKKTNFEFAGEQDVERSWKLPELWQVAGWVYFKRGDLQRAQNYLEAAWTWEQFPIFGDHLAQLYIKQGRKDDAIEVWAVALGTGMLHQPDVQARFVQAVGDRERAHKLEETRRLRSQELRTIAVPNSSKSSGMAEVYVLFAPGPKIVGLSISDGDAKMQKLEPALKKAAIPLRFPDTSSVQLVRSGFLSCSSMTPNCTLVLKPAPSARMSRGDDF